jgi:hypothetical protein
MLRVNEANVKSMLNAEINYNAMFATIKNEPIIYNVTSDPIKNE